MAAGYILLSVLVVSLIAIIAAIPFFVKRKPSDRLLLFLLSMSVGVMLGAVLFNFLPEAVEDGYHLGIGIQILMGFLVMFIVEKFVHWHHSQKREAADCAHSHAYSLAPINLIGDGIHNFIDGLVIAGSYAVNVTMGITATISVIFHEVPQEIADMGVLLYSGYSLKKAIFFNVLSAAAAFLGAFIGIYLTKNVHAFSGVIIPFAAGNFIYIAASNLLPQLHRHCRFWDSLMHVMAIILGVGLVLLITVLGPVHMH